MIAFVSKSEADYRTLRQVADLVSQAVVSCADMEEAHSAIRCHGAQIVVLRGARAGHGELAGVD